MSFGGGGGASTGVNAHWHNSQTDNGGPLQLKNDTTTGSTVQFNGGTEVPMEVMM